MAKKGNNLATNIRLGTRVRHVEDGVEGKIVWANAASVKIQWDDGEKVTWKRAEPGAKGLAVVEADEAVASREASAPVETAAVEPTTAPVEPTEVAPAAEATEVTPTEQPAAATALADVVGAEPATTPSTPTRQPFEANGEPTPAAEGPAEPTANKRRPRAAKPDAGAPKKPSALDAAAKVLAEEMRPMGCRELIGLMAAKGYWTSPGGKTPAATLYSALLREIDTKGDAARFVRTGRGTFALRPQA